MSRLFLLLGVFLMTACGSFDRGPSTPRKTVKDLAVESPRAGAAQGPRKRLLILPFLDANEKRSPEIRERSREVFMIDLNRSGELLAVDSQDMKTDTNKFLKNGEYDLAAVAKESRNLGVAAVLEGKIVDLRIQRTADRVGVIRQMTSTFEAVVRARMVSGRTGREIFNTVKTVTLEQQNVRVAERVEADQFIRANPELIQTIVKDAFLDFTPQILSALDRVQWEGRIAAINGDRIYLNVGRLSGLQIGDLLKVSEEGDDVYDPESGSHLGRVPGRMKGTLEVISYFGTDGSITVIHSGAGFKENDRVEFYQ